MKFNLRHFVSGFALAIIFAIASQTAARAQASFDRPGNDYVRSAIKSGDPKDCALRCERDRRCKAWSFSYPVPGGEGAMCALKSAVPARIESTCCVSGVRGAGVLEPRDNGIEVSIDRPGGDYRHFPIRRNGNEESCRKACDADRRCRAWTYVRPGYYGASGRCYLKSSIRPPKRKPCCISGVVR